MKLVLFSDCFNEERIFYNVKSVRVNRFGIEIVYNNEQYEVYSDNHWRIDEVEKEGGSL